MNKTILAVLLLAASVPQASAADLSLPAAFHASDEGRCDEDPDADGCPTKCYGQPPEQDFCLEQRYCMTHPDAHPCTGATQQCSDGFYGWDTDRDGTCDMDDTDDDNDGVPDYCDPDPRSYDDPVTNALDRALALVMC